MKLGFFTRPVHPIGKNWQQSLNEDRQAILLADELQFVEAYAGEHLSDSAENITSCGMFMASLAYQTKQIRLGTGTVNIPNLHPVHIAGQVAMLDHMLNGRFNFGISPGGLISDAELFGTLNQDRAEMFLEGINMVLEIWQSEPPYNISGKYWQVSTESTMMKEIGQGIMTKPLQQPHPPIVVTAVAPFSKGVCEAAARGWDPISADIIMPIWVASHWQKYKEGCDKVNRVADPANWRVAKAIFVADDLAKAKEYALGPNSPYVFYYKQLFTKFSAMGKIGLFKTDINQSDEDVTFDDVCKKMIIWGTTDKVIDDLSTFRDEVGDFGTLMYAGMDWADAELARRSMILTAEKVVPLL
ncbi:LLM class flavin-dependent oxidoreductase [Alphaproteobacteria bacterium]|nr:LLM class flavin-dependent oxidoreductase [Alphaproteobacteria bacterium]